MPTNKRKHAAWLIDLINKNDFKIGAELGLGKTITSRMIMNNTNVFLIGVDHAAKPHWAKIQIETAEIYKNRYKLIQKTTEEASKQIEDNSLDFVFVDAGHSYRAVCADIKNWFSKVKDGGCFCGHDYGHVGVKKAVNELIPDASIDVDANIWYIWKGIV